MATTDNTYYSEFEGRSTGPSTLGENRFISLEDIVNNYMVLYADESNHGGTAKRMKVEAFAQRAIQEYSYDTFRVQTWEYEVIDRATFPMPQDFVELVGINYVDDYGVERSLRPRSRSSNPMSPLQFNNTPVWDEGSTYAQGDYIKYLPEGEMDQDRNYVVYRAIQDVVLKINSYGFTLAQWTANVPLNGAVELVAGSYIQGDLVYFTTEATETTPQSTSNFIVTQSFDLASTPADMSEAQAIPEIERTSSVNFVGVTNPIPSMDSDWLEVQSGLTGYVYGSDGNIIFFEDSSYTKTQYDENNRTQNLLGGTLEDGTQRTYGYGYYGKRYYAEASELNANPTYYVNDRNGVIDLDPVLIGEVINLTYISDGLSGAMSEIKVHKFAEQAVYEFIYFEMIAHSSKVPANEKERAKRRMVAKNRQAKLRLMELSPRDLIQVLRNQSTWIKT